MALVPPERADSRGIFRSDGLNPGDHGRTSLERLHLSLDRSQPLPEQIARTIAAFLVNGIIHPSERLPTIEVAAKHLGVGRQTMLLAYTLLRRHGILTSSPQRGTYLTDNAHRIARRYLLSDRADALIYYGHSLGLHEDEMVGIFLAALQRIERQHEGATEEP